MLLALGQVLLNEQISASTAARDRLAELDGKRFAVVVRGTDFRIVAESAEGRLGLRHDTEAACDVELCAGAIDLVRLARSAGLSGLKDTGATLNGDIRVAEAFADLFRLASPEPEALLARFLGDIPAHAAGEAARATAAASRRAVRAFEQNLAEYLQEENPTLLPPALMREFTARVDRLRDDAARAERRIELLERRHRAGDG